MLRGGQVLLRAVRRADVERIAAWELEPETWRLADDAAYVPRTPADVLTRYDAGETMHVTATSVPFVVEADGEVVGATTLWGIDLHHRRAHLGITLAPAARGMGHGTDACRVLLRYAFDDRGLHRVQLETLASNAAAIAA